MFIKALTSYTDKGICLVQDGVYDLSQETLNDIAKKTKAAKKPAFRYEKITPPWDAKKDLSAMRLSEYTDKAQLAQIQLDNQLASQSAIQAQIVEYQKTLAEFDKLSEKDRKSIPYIGLVIRKTKALLDLASVDMEIVGMEIKESETTTQQLADLIQKEKAKEQQTPDDKQLHGQVETK